MTFAQIVAKLEEGKLHWLLNDLRSAVEDEARALAIAEYSKSVDWAARESAQDYYAEEITAALRMSPADRVITPTDVLHHRRTPTAKAIAALMLDAGIT